MHYKLHYISHCESALPIQVIYLICSTIEDLEKQHGKIEK